MKNILKYFTDFIEQIQKHCFWLWMIFFNVYQSNLVKQKSVIDHAADVLRRFVMVSSKMCDTLTKLQQFN